MGVAELNLALYIFTIIGAGFASYFGVKIAIAEVKRDIKHQGEQLDDHNERIIYLERKHSSKSG